VPREKPEDVQLGGESDLTANFERLLASPNICSTRWITEQYESYVQLVGTQRPGGDAGVLRVKGTERGLAMALDGNGRWCWLDPKLGATHAVAEAARNVACAGARPIGATNCLNFGNPEKPGIMWQFSQVVDGMTRACEELETPITGGNVSFYNETLGEGIYPTPVVGIVGLIEHVDRAMTHDFRNQDRAIVLLRGSEPGDATDAEAEFGSSEYAQEIVGQVWGFPPAIELEKEKALQDCIIDIVGLGLIDSAHDCSEGGLAVTVAESCFPRDIGARVELKREDLGGEDLLPEYLLFGEDASRIVISCVRENVPGIKEVAVKYGVAAFPIGVTQSEHLEIFVDDRAVVSAPVSQMKDAWENALERALHTEAEERLAPEILQKS
jgi:phosphoribosylformylglycinamidine synthase